MFAGNEFVGRLAAKGAEAHQQSELEPSEDGAEAVAAVTLYMAEQYPNNSILVSHVAALRKRVPSGGRRGESASGCPRMRWWLDAGRDP